MQCRDCKSTKMKLSRDLRGLYEFRCADCGGFIKKCTTAEVAEWYQNIIASAPPKIEEKKPMCKYCTEKYFVRLGRLGTTYNPVDAFYCPICGRKLEESDTKY